MNDRDRRLLRSRFRLPLSLALIVSGVAVMGVTEGSRQVRVVDEGWVVRQVHAWDLVSLPLLFGGITLLVLWGRARRRPVE